MDNGVFQHLYQKVLHSDLSSFIAKAFQSTNPGTLFQGNWHIDAIAAYLEACSKGEITRLIINMPPRALKSLCVSVAWPAWVLGKDPSTRVIVASYAQSLSLKHSLDCRLIMQSSWYQELFPEVEIAKDQNEKSKFTTTKRGFRFATSVGGTLTGEGGDILILDDPHNPTQAASSVKRKSTLDWFDQTFLSRLDNKHKGVVVVVMQRLHPNDLTGYIKEKKGGFWQLLELPAIAESRQFIEVNNKSWERNVGEVLHPQREDAKILERTKEEMGSYAFSAQYQQKPVPEEGGLIKPIWIERFDSLPSDYDRIIQSWDTAIKVNEISDYSVCSCWMQISHTYYLVDLVRDRFEYPLLKKVVIQYAQKWNVDTILIEDKASGQSLAQDLHAETSLPVVPICPKGDKITRVAAISSLFESGRVYFPKNASWLAELESELYAFPSVQHDDQADSISQFLNWVKRNRRYLPRVRNL